MLIVTRRAGQEIVIHGEIRVQVLSINGRRIRIGVTAPKAVRLERGEIHERRLGKRNAGGDDPSCADVPARVGIDARRSHWIPS